MQPLILGPADPIPFPPSRARCAVAGAQHGLTAAGALRGLPLLLRPAVRREQNEIAESAVAMFLREGSPKEDLAAYRANFDWAVERFETAPPGLCRVKIETDLGPVWVEEAFR